MSNKISKEQKNWSKLNQISEKLLKESKSCYGCPFAGEYDDGSSLCNHPHNKIFHDFSRQRRPVNCPLRWRC